MSKRLWQLTNVGNDPIVVRFSCYCGTPREIRNPDPGREDTHEEVTLLSDIHVDWFSDIVAEKRTRAPLNNVGAGYLFYTYKLQSDGKTELIRSSREDTVNGKHVDALAALGRFAEQACARFQEQVEATVVVSVTREERKDGAA